MSRIFFTSDSHYGHTNVIKYSNRPYDSIGQMNAELTRLWNETVTEDDTIYYLGDFSLSYKWVQECAGNLKGNKILVVGNHDACFNRHDFKKLRQPGQYLKYFKEVHHDLSLPMKINGIQTNLQLCHFPFAEAEEGYGFPIRYPDHRPQNKGQTLLHGHVHNLWKKKGRCINVGVDVWDYKPVSLEQIEEVLLHKEDILADPLLLERQAPVADL